MPKLNPVAYHPGVADVLSLIMPTFMTFVPMCGKSPGEQRRIERHGMTVVIDDTGVSQGKPVVAFKHDSFDFAVTLDFSTGTGRCESLELRYSGDLHEFVRMMGGQPTPEQDKRIQEVIDATPKRSTVVTDYDETDKDTTARDIEEIAHYLLFGWEGGGIPVEHIYVGKQRDTYEADRCDLTIEVWTELDGKPITKSTWRKRKTEAAAIEAFTAEFRNKPNRLWTMRKLIIDDGTNLIEYTERFPLAMNPGDTFEEGGLCEDDSHDGSGQGHSTYDIELTITGDEDEACAMLIDTLRPGYAREVIERRRARMADAARAFSLTGASDELDGQHRSTALKGLGKGKGK